VFLIGNSLTWDTIPAKLDGEVQWHVDCGKSLPFIVDNPSDPCVKTSTLWPDALQDRQNDLISIQVHYGSTLGEDVDAISRLIEKQPKAELIIHTGWARSADRAAEWAMNEQSVSTPMNHHRAYFDALLASLRKRHPGRTFRRTHAIDLLQQVSEDIAAGTAPITEIDELYRDAIHMDLKTGRYLMHNAMRHAFGQRRSADGFEGLEPAIKTYLDSVLDRVLESPDA
jgi:hypothetical protein